MGKRNGNGFEDPEKRQAILDQAIQIFAECGFRGTDIQVIADRAGVGKGTVYRYFHNKDDLFWATTFEVVCRLRQQVFGAMEGIEGVCNKIRASAVAYARFFESNPQCLEVFVQDRAEFRGTAPESHREYHREMIREFERILQQGMESGEILPSDTFQTTHAIGSLLYGIVVQGCHLTSVSAEEMVKHSIEILLRGIRADIASVTEPN